MNITIIGSGYVGLVSGICFADIGHQITCVDKDKRKIKILERGEIPIFEPGLKELLLKNKSAGRISFSTSLEESLAKCDVAFIAVGTPQDEDGSADMSYVIAAAKEINELCQKIGKKDLLIVTKSTVPTGTADRIRAVLSDNDNIKVASNPEFLREGSALDDFMNPDRIVIGCDDDYSAKILNEVYGSFPADKIVRTTTKTAELIKYTSNAFLATKIAFINEIANLCERTGADIKELARAVGLDSRIGEKFLNAGPGFGGSCFPKDVSAIINIANEARADVSIVKAVENSNKHRKASMAKRIIEALGGEKEAEGKTVAALGLAFKASTDDVRYSPAITIIKELSRAGINVRASDFEAIENSKEELRDFANISYFDDAYEATQNCDLTAILTEWPEYKNLNLAEIKKAMKGDLICDLRNMLDHKKAVETGFKYDYIGKYKNND